MSVQARVDTQRGLPRRVKRAWRALLALAAGRLHRAGARAAARLPPRPSRRRRPWRTALRPAAAPVRARLVARVRRSGADRRWSTRRSPTIPISRSPPRGSRKRARRPGCARAQLAAADRRAARRRPQAQTLSPFGTPSRRVSALSRQLTRELRPRPVRPLRPGQPRRARATAGQRGRARHGAARPSSQQHRHAAISRCARSTRGWPVAQGRRSPVARATRCTSRDGAREAGYTSRPRTAAGAGRISRAPSSSFPQPSWRSAGRRMRCRLLTGDVPGPVRAAWRSIGSRRRPIPTACPPNCCAAVPICFQAEQTLVAADRSARQRARSDAARPLAHRLGGRGAVDRAAPTRSRCSRSARACSAPIFDGGRLKRAGRASPPRGATRPRSPTAAPRSTAFREVDDALAGGARDRASRRPLSHAQRAALAQRAAQRHQPLPRGLFLLSRAARRAAQPADRRTRGWSRPAPTGSPRMSRCIRRWAAEWLPPTSRRPRADRRAVPASGMTVRRFLASRNRGPYFPGGHWQVGHSRRSPGSSPCFTVTRRSNTKHSPSQRLSASRTCSR